MSTLNVRDEVFAFVAERTELPLARLNPQTTLMGDLGIDGADAHDLMMAFERRFAVDMSTYRARRHFRPEGLPMLSPLDWPDLAFRHLTEKESTPESRARRVPITLQDLIDSATARKWVLVYEKPA